MKNPLTKNITYLLFLFFTLFKTQHLKAQVIAWDFADATTTGAVDATTNHENLVISSLSRGAGLSAGSLTGAYNSSSFTESASLETAIAQSEYLEFKIIPKSGYKVSLTNLEANFRRSTTGPSKFQWRYSLNGFETAGVNIGTEITFSSTLSDGVAQPTTDLSGITALQNVASPVVITVRLYGYGATSGAGTFALGRPTTPANDLAILGTVTAVSTMPVQLTSFEAKANVNGVRLNWTTESEFNNRAFTVERSQDNTTFAPVGFVKGAGTSAEKKYYSISDNSVLKPGTYYYRLKQTDFNGSATFTEPCIIKIFSKASNLAVYPNPSADRITIDYDPQSPKIGIKLLDLGGNIALSGTGSLREVQERINGLYGTLPSGMYTLQVQDGLKLISKKIIKQ